MFIIIIIGAKPLPEAISQDDLIEEILRSLSDLRLITNATISNKILQLWWKIMFL